MLPGHYSREVTVGAALVRLRVLSGISAADELSDVWQHVETVSDASLFLAWPWVRSWLAEIVRTRQIVLLEIYRGNALEGLLLVSLFQRRILGAASRVAFLNELPLAGHNMVVEKNGVVAVHGREPELFFAAMRALADSDLGIDEIRCSAVDERYIEEPLLRSCFAVALDERNPCWLLGKEEVPLSQDALLNTFSKNKRGQIGRFRRQAEQAYGAVTVTIARDEEQALIFFERLELLHTRYWRSQGLPGSFGNARWKRFHWALIRTLLPTGRVQLLRVTAGEEELGYLYNIGQRAVMSNIQSGFVYRDDNRWRPGYLSHLAAAEVAAQCGYVHYDLLMGDDGYKSSIARVGSWLSWFSLFPAESGLWRNPRYWQRQLLELYRWVRTSSKPKAQGEPRS